MVAPKRHECERNGCGGPYDGDHKTWIHSIRCEYERLRAEEVRVAALEAVVAVARETHRPMRAQANCDLCLAFERLDATAPRKRPGKGGR